MLRVDALDTRWGAADSPRGRDPNRRGAVPKVESADQVLRTVSMLDAGGAPSTLAIWCMFETPLRVLAAGAIAAASPRIAALVAGTSDLAKELHALRAPDRLPLLPRSA